MWNDVQGQIKDFVQMLLKPVAMFHNPFYKRPHKLILCDTWLTDEEPAAVNRRYSCKNVMEQLKQFQDVIDPWYGIEQEYFVCGKNGLPVSYDPVNFDYKKLFMFSKCGFRHDANMSIERDLSSNHMLACRYAGIKYGGNIRENSPSQWEYQIGPCPGESIGDHLNMARYILCRLAERLELRISLQPLPVTPLTSGGHLNFSTKQMRNEDGMRYIEQAIKVLENSDEEKLLSMYDPALLKENKERLLNAGGIGGHPILGQFVGGGSGKEFETVRIPPHVKINGCGYLEDRRPSSALDPYSAAEGIVKAVVFGEYLKADIRESLRNDTYY